MQESVIKLKMPFDIATVVDSTLKLLGGALGVKVFEFYINKRKSKETIKRKHEFLSSLKDISEMNMYMSDVIENTPADRFLILMGHDSGNIPNPKHPYFTRALWQRVKDDYDNDSLLIKFETSRVDLKYINMIIELMTTGSVKLNVDEMDDCFLKTIYKGEGIKYSEVYFLAQEKSNKIYYCSIATSKNNEMFQDSEHRAKIELAVNHLSQIFSKI